MKVCTEDGRNLLHRLLRHSFEARQPMYFKQLNDEVLKTYADIELSH
jgi:hypothetical protein